MSAQKKKSGICCNPFGDHSGPSLRSAHTRPVTDEVQIKALRIGKTLRTDFICDTCRLKIDREWNKRPSDLETAATPVDINPNRGDIAAPSMAAFEDEPTEMDVVENPQPVDSGPSTSGLSSLPRLRPRKGVPLLEDFGSSAGSEQSVVEPTQSVIGSEGSGGSVMLDVERINEAVGALFDAFSVPFDKSKLDTIIYSTKKFEKLTELLRKTVFTKAKMENFGDEMIEPLKEKYHE